MERMGRKTGNHKEDLKELGLTVGAGILEHLTGLGAVIKIGGGLANYIKKRRQARADMFKKAITNSPPEAQAILKSPESAEPLVDVFLSVYKKCLEDEEDEKAEVYAALMAGFALKQDQHSKRERLAMLNTVADLQLHELKVFSRIAQLALRSSPHAPVPESAFFTLHPQGPLGIETRLVCRGFSASENKGLIEILSPSRWDEDRDREHDDLTDDGVLVAVPTGAQSSAAKETRYILLDHGKDLWFTLSDSLPADWKLRS